ncbi:MAG: Rieske 2Fe-2S domain-containing protein [Actinobacteria bacterium]|nr:Rieske 2Fe-2S domain-containing protein [Actinomycetota bacterium]
MNTAAIVIVIIVVGILGAVFLLTTSARRDRRSATGMLSRETRSRDRGSAVIEELEAEQGATGPTGREVERAAEREWRGGGTAVVVAPTPAPPALREPLDPEAIGVTRRQFFNRGIVTMMGLGLAGFGGSMIAFLWPSLSGGFGSKINAGSLDGTLNTIRTTREPVYVPDARSYINPYPTDHIGSASKVYTGPVLDGMKEGVVALYQKCVHLGCRVPWCKSSQWFECPCHGSKYNRVGEKKGGPAPRGLDRFGVSIEGGNIMIDTKTVVLGPAIGTNTTGQEAEGPHCA